MLIVDDLCECGGTFAGVAAAIREINPDAQIDIAVTHMVNPKRYRNPIEEFPSCMVYQFLQRLGKSS